MISVDDLMGGPAWNLYRTEHRQRLIAHRRVRTVPLGPAMRLQFEDDSTLRYQIQEVLRVERLHDARSMQDEIDTYAHLMPDGAAWNATLLIELPDPAERARQLPPLNRAVRRLYIEAGNQPRAWGRVNEDLENRHEHRDSAVHFVRFPLPDGLRAALLAGAGAVLGCAHPAYAWQCSIPAQSLQRLVGDLAAPAHQPSSIPSRPAALAPS